jgi:hypothetical protein
LSGQGHNNDSTYHDSKSNNDDIDQLKKELVANQDQHESDNYYTSLKVELDSKIPDRDYAEFVIRTIKRTVKQEDSLVRLIVYTAISKDTSNPINLAVLAPTSEGKTYAVLESIQYFPKQDIWKIGSMTPKVIIRQNGILVDSNNEPLEDRLKELKRKIKETDNSDEKEDLKQQLSQMYNEAKVLIDLRGKLWVFLEPPHRETWAILKPILSHDDFEIEHPYVYEVQGMGFKVKKVVTRGWPACIFCSAKNESDWPAWPEIQSRFLVTSPNMIQEKYSDGNMLIAQKMGLPNLLQQSIIVSNSQIELAKKSVLYILQQIRQRNSDNTNPVWIPYTQIIAKILPAEKGTDNRITKRMLSLLTIITLARSHLRGRLVYGSESLAITDIDEDLHEVLHITQNLSGIPPYKLKFFKEFFLPLYESKQGPNKSEDNSKEERIPAVTTRELCEFYKEKAGKTITTNNLKETYLKEFLYNGLIEEEDSVLDGRQKIYYPLIDFPIIGNYESYRKIKKLSNSDRMDNILQHSRLLMPKNCINVPANWLELEIFDLIKYPFEIDKFEIYDEENERICICKFLKDYEKKYSLNGYFSRPNFYNYHSKIFGPMTCFSTIGEDECKKLSSEDQMHNLVISNMPKSADNSSEIVAKEGSLALRHSPAAHVLTNNDLEDVEECGIENSSSNGISVDESL